MLFRSTLDRERGDLDAIVRDLHNLGTILKGMKAFDRAIACLQEALDLKNLQDHMSSHVAFLRKEPGVVHRKMRADRILLDLASTYMFGKGLSTSLPGGEMAFLGRDGHQRRLGARLQREARVGRLSPKYWMARIQ